MGERDKPVMNSQPLATTTPAAAAQDPMLPAICRIRRMKRETHDTFTMEIEPEKAGGGRKFDPGQFNMVYVYGVGEAPISISSNPDEPMLIKHTTREVGTVTRAMRRLTAGATVGIRGPFGNGWPMDAARGKDVVLVAGGIGLAPLRSALYRLVAQREHYGKIVLLYGTRAPTDILFKREMESWRARLGLEIHVTVDRAISNWRGHVGVVTKLIPSAPFEPRQSVAMICGPEIMMRYAVMELARRGVKDSNIYVSMERNMKCAVGYCGHCQFGPTFICKDGPVFRYDRVARIVGKSEV
jgi:NAD(P)H-flavin reductase